MAGWSVNKITIPGQASRRRVGQIPFVRLCQEGIVIFSSRRNIHQQKTTTSKTKTLLNEIFFLDDMVIVHTRSKRKPSGGRYKSTLTKRKAAKGAQPTLTKISERKTQNIRSRGGNHKTRLLSTNKANVLDPKTKKYEVVGIKSVVETPSNRHFVRRNIIVKGSIIETDKGKAKVTSRPGQEGTLNAVLI